MLTEAPSKPRPYSRPKFASQIADILSDNSLGEDACFWHQFGALISLSRAKRARTPIFGTTGRSGSRLSSLLACGSGTSTGAPMHEVSGVRGAAPILHGIFDHLHATRGTSYHEKFVVTMSRRPNRFGTSMRMATCSFLESMEMVCERGELLAQRGDCGGQWTRSANHVAAGRCGLRCGSGCADERSNSNDGAGRQAVDLAE